MTFSRRTFFKMSSAAGLFVLPVLRSTRALGQTAAPKRLVFLHSPLGTVRSDWLCTGSESTFTLSPILQPLAALKSHLLVIDGLNFAPLASLSGESTGNHKEPGSMLTGRSCSGRDEASKHGNISIDQYLKTKMPSSVPVKSLELLTAYNNEFSAEADRSLFSARGVNLPVIPETNPQTAFDRLFTGVTGTGTPTTSTPDPAAEALRLRRRSVLDAVVKEIGSLQGQLTGGERAKLDQHLTSVRELEQGFSAPTTTTPVVRAGCTVPARPASINPFENATIPARLKSHMQLVASAMACDLVRVAVIGSENGQGRASPGWVGSGYNTNWHDAFTHNTGGHTQHAAIHRWYVEQFAFLVGLFKSIPEGAGTMLDNTAVVLFSEQGCRYASGGPSEHSKQNLPFVVAGSCGGYFKQNRFVTLPSGSSHKDFLFNCLAAMGHAETTFGNVSGTPFSGLKA